MAAWSAKALLITVGVFLVGGAIWYARAATVPLIVAALISTQLLPLIELATRRGMSRGLAVAASLLGVVVIGVGLAWVFTHALFGNLGGVGEDISEGADRVVAWLGDNNDWVEQHDDAIHDFLKSILPTGRIAALPPERKVVRVLAPYDRRSRSRAGRARLCRRACHTFKYAGCERHVPRAPHVSLLEGPGVDRVAVANEPEHAGVSQLNGGPLVKALQARHDDGVVEHPA
jgi:hypothetical protein